jgi:hypothetical protein
MRGQKTGGRKAGSLNKLTQETRELILSLSDKYLSSDLESLEPRDRAVILTKLLSYILPKPTTENTGEDFNQEPLVIVRTEYIDKPDNKILSKVD